MSSGAERAAANNNAPDDGDVAAAAGLGAAVATPNVIDVNEACAYVLPPGYQVATLRGDMFSDIPSRAEPRHTVVRDETSFIRLAEQLADDGDVRRVYADPVGANVQAVGPNVQAILNDGGWRDRRIQLALTHTPQWNEWMSINDRFLTQRDFVEFLENHLADIHEPAAAGLLEIAQTLEGTTQATWATAVRLANGNRRFAYEETTTASAGENGQLEIPEKFVLALTPWVGRTAAVPFSIDAMLRYRIENRQLRLGVHLVDVDRIVETSFMEDIVKPIGEALGEVILGTP